MESGFTGLNEEEAEHKANAMWHHETESLLKSYLNFYPSVISRVIFEKNLLVFNLKDTIKKIIFYISWLKLQERFYLNV